MLPRALRVSRCKAPHKTARAMERADLQKTLSSTAKDSKTNGYVRKLTGKEQSMAGRAEKLFGRNAATRGSHGDANGKSVPRHRSRGSGEGKETIVFEGRRASSTDAKPRDLKVRGARGKKSSKGAANKKRQQDTGGEAHAARNRRI